MNENSQSWFELIGLHLKALDFSPEIIKSEHVYKFDASGNKSTYNVFVVCGSGDVGKVNAFVTVLVYDPRLVFKELRSEMLEMLNAANHKTAIGNFELHGVDTSRVVFKVGAALFANLEQSAFSMQLYGAISHMDDMQNAIGGILNR